MDNFKKHFSKILLIATLVFAALYMYFGYQDRIYHLNEGTVRYTTGEIIDFNWGAKSPPVFTFNFFIENKSNKAYYSINDELRSRINSQLAKDKYIGKNYLIKYSIDKPKYNELYLKKPIPDSLSHCLKCTWEIPPF